MFLLYLILNIYLILSFKIKKQKIIKNFSYIISMTNMLIIFCTIILYIIVFYYIFAKIKFLFIFVIYSSIDFLSFLVRCLIIKIYYKTYISSSLNPNFIVMMQYYPNIVIYVFFLIYYSFCNLLYEFDPVFDDAFLGLYKGYKIRLKKSGSKKVIKYQKFLLNQDFTQPSIWGEDFLFKETKVTAMYDYL